MSVGLIYFGNVENAGSKLKVLISATTPRVILLDCSATPGFEYAALRMLVETEARCGRKARACGSPLHPETLELVQHTRLVASRPSPRSRCWVSMC